jgi:mannose-6-phosphate isomerase-like protein (cupin superfamily)
MHAFTLSDALARQGAAGGPWAELLSVPDLSFGIYVLPAGGTDPQDPHTEDEVYVVLAGRAQFTAGDETVACGPGDETVACGPGDILFVPALVPHKFHDITDELRVVVVFGPAEYSRRGGASAG